MTIHKLSTFTKGWIIGDFEPSIIRTKEFEFMIRYYSAGDQETKHVHKMADEITVVVSGHFRMNGTDIAARDIVHLKPGEPTDFLCLEDGATVVIKMPSVIGDKYLI